MSILEKYLKRIQAGNRELEEVQNAGIGLSQLSTRINRMGGSDQWVRMREDKLRSLKKALLYSYQRAIVQKYDVKSNSKASYIISLITKMQDLIELSQTQINFLIELEAQYQIEAERGTEEYISKLEEIVDELVNSMPLFRCLINHDKLKVDYEDKIISIPFQEIPLTGDTIEETNFHNGTVFKWVHGNKEEWTPDTYWIVYMQYSEETAYFRAEIRKADEEIEIITVDDQGNENSAIYRGWMTGPNETSILWNTKKNVTWNDMNYTKLLYITKDEDTLAFFKRFDRVIINGKPWQVQAYNENYSTTKRGEVDSGIIRVALKETYIGSSQFVQEVLDAAAQVKEAQDQYDKTHTEARIEGPARVKPYSVLTFVAKNFENVQTWSISNTKIAKIKKISEDGTIATIQIITGVANKEGFDVNYGALDQTKVHVVIDSM